MKATTAFPTQQMQQTGQVADLQMTRFCGVDGCHFGWIAVFCAGDFSNVEWRVARSWTELPLHAAIVAVDMPIGLNDIPGRGCDTAARAALRPYGRAQSVFTMPVRRALDFDDYAQANAWSKREGHGGIVKQAWMLRKKILEVEAATHSGRDVQIFESHPELAFAQYCAPPLQRKKSAEGQRQRLDILLRLGVVGLSDILGAVPRSQAEPDDVIDAAILMVSAQRIATGRARDYPFVPMRNRQGVAMKITV